MAQKATTGRRLCDPCPDRPRCTKSREGRTITFLPRHLHEAQAHNPTEQQEEEWRRTYAARSGVQGTICELANGHRARRSRYHGLAKTHVQHVLTGIAINIERLSAHALPTLDRPRSLTAFQLYLDARGLTWERWWRQGH